jgi:hypothetical protein
LKGFMAVATQQEKNLREEFNSELQVKWGIEATRCKVGVTCSEAEELGVMQEQIDMTEKQLKVM